ncbi:MAG: EF-hand domain-containing protein [Verrucomicrobia bacterium]|nr:EF-hand domain-containing protein [Verrucomicrobiota bacterium]
MKKLNGTLLALALAGATLTAIAQNEDRPQPPGGPDGPGGRPRMISPLMEALDKNHDGVLDADEIKNAATALLKLDKNGDGKLTQEELRPARPPGGRGPGGPGGPGGPDREGRPQGEGRPGRPEKQ